MYFDFEDHRPDISPIGRESASARQVRLISIGPLSLYVAMGWQPSQIVAAVATALLYLTVLAVIIKAPQLFRPDAAAIERARLAMLNLQQQDQGRFVFVQPRLDMTTPKNRADLSDEDRAARARERALDPANALPFARGNSPEPAEKPPEQTPARGRGPDPDPAAGQQRDQAKPVEDLPESRSALQSPVPPRPPSLAGADGRNQTPGGSLGDALRNPGRFIDSEAFDNPKGGVSEFGPIQFDTKGVEFGPWVRRFVAQVKRNWFVPNAALMGLKGHVVITFNVHKSGAITDLTVIGPCPIEAFNSAAFGALLSSNPTQPLPPEYPSEKAFFTVTFFYNETPAAQ